MLIFLFVFILLTLLNAYFSAIEIAMVSIRPLQIQQMIDNGGAREKRLVELLKNPEEYLSSIQVGITLVAIIEGFYGGEVLLRYLEPRLLHWGLSASAAHALGLLIGIGGITYITILLGELLPKSLALRNPQQVALQMTATFLFFTKLFYPFVQLLTWSTRGLLKIFAIKSPGNKKLTDSDIKGILSLAYRQGTLEEKELKLHENIFTFYDLRIQQIMVPSHKVSFIKESMRPEEVIDVIKGNAHNFFPVISDDNKVVGILQAKVFLLNQAAVLKSLLRPAAKITGNEKTSDVLLTFQKSLTNFGVITGDASELLGIVTMHDIGEALLGKFA